MTLTPRTDAILADDTGDSSLIRNLATLARTLERELNAAKAKSELCQCSLATRLVGDGCERCNPEKAREIKEQNYEDRISDLERELNDANEQLHKVRIRCSEWADVAGKRGAEMDVLLAALESMVAANGGVAVMPTIEARNQNAALMKANAAIAKAKGKP
jgi:hypothetical protein